MLCLRPYCADSCSPLLSSQVQAAEQGLIRHALVLCGLCAHTKVGTKCWKGTDILYSGFVFTLVHSNLYELSFLILCYR